MRPLLPLFIIVLFAPMAWATMVEIEYIPGGTWSAQFLERGFSSPGTWANAPFDTFAVQIAVGPGALATPGLAQFNPSSWGVYRQLGSSLVVGHGPTISGDLSWYFHFQDPSSNRLVLDYVAYAPDGTRLISQQLSWNGSGWNVTPDLGASGWDPGRDFLLIPAPAAVLLGAIGVSLVHGLRRRLT